MIIRSVAPDAGAAAPAKRGFSAKLTIVIIILIMVGVAAFSEVLSYFSPGGPSANAYLVTIEVPDGAAVNTSATFSPATVTVILGINNTVEWVSLDKTPNALHTVVFTQIPANANITAASLSSYPASPGFRYDVYWGPILLPAAGVYQYQDHYYSWLKGTIVVKG